MRWGALALLVFGVSAPFVCCAETITWAQVAPAAQTIAKSFFDTPDIVERRVEKNQVVFHLTGGKEGKDAELEVTSGGKLLNSEQEVAFADLLPTVQKEVGTLTEKAKLEGITKIFDGQQLTYEVEITKGSQDLSFCLNEQGIVISSEEEIAFEKLPASVQKSIRAEIGNARIHVVTKVIEDDETSFDIEAKKKNGKTLELSVDSDGDLISMEISFAQLPKAVQESVREKTSDGKITSISKSTEGGEVFYDVEMKNGDREFVLSFGDDGLLSSEDEKLALADLPMALQKAIRTEAPRDSRISEIWRCHDEDGITYDVEFLRTHIPQPTLHFIESENGYHLQ